MTWLDAIEAWPGAVLLKNSGTIYLFVNAAHILGLGLLVGGIVPLDLRLAGMFRSVPLRDVGPFLIGIARTGFVLAVATGLLLFTVNAKEYAANSAFLAKLALLAAALIVIVLQHRGPSLRAAIETGIVPGRVAVLAVLSASLWVAVVVAGRWIGFI